MKEANSLGSLSQELGLTPEEIAQRKEFLEFTEADVALLREIHGYLEDPGLQESFVDTLYRHLFSSSALHEFAPDQSDIDRLKSLHACYFSDLTAGSYDMEYVTDRLRVGFASQQLGLESKWYTAAYRKYLSSLILLLSRKLGHDPEKFARSYDALLKVVFFDMELALGTYFQADRQALLHAATHDELTGLPNRVLLHDRLSQALHKADRDQQAVVVLFLDIDRIKNINDSLGHAVADKVILEVANRLASHVRGGDTVARWGGDEFVVVLAGVEREESVRLIAQKILDAIAQSVVIDGMELSVTGSMGIVYSPIDGNTQEELLKNADTAMHQAKQNGRNTFVYYRSEMNAQALRRLNLETRLRRALDRGEFLLHYHPLVDVLSGKIVGVEALLRWQTEEGLVPPMEFIPLAEETGLILPIGEWVLKAACQQLIAWSETEMLPRMWPFKMAINLSARQFWQQDMAKLVARTANGMGCDTHYLELEITESSIMKRPEEAVNTLRELSEMGITIAIDDFGTGYSSLNYLNRFPIHTLKIDRAFVREIDAGNTSIVDAIIALAHSLKLRVIAEGVEKAEQLAYLMKHECNLIQGFHLYRPQPVEEMTQLLRHNLGAGSAP